MGDARHIQNRRYETCMEHCIQKTKHRGKGLHGKPTSVWTDNNALK